MAAVASVGSTQDPKWPTCPALKKLPSTPAELFEALGGTIEHATDTRYGWPWPGYTSWRDAGERLSHFCKCVDTEWTDFNDSAGNEGIMSASGHADKALVENLMNGFDAKLEHLASEYLNGEPGKTMPGSPFEAVKMWSGGYSPDMLPSMTDRQIADLAKSSLLVRLFADPKTTSKNQKEDSRCIVDIRDYGCGIAPEDFRKTICSLNRPVLGTVTSSRSRSSRVSGTATSRRRRSST